MASISNIREGTPSVPQGTTTAAADSAAAPSAQPAAPATGGIAAISQPPPAQPVRNVTAAELVRPRIPATFARFQRHAQQGGTPLYHRHEVRVPEVLSQPVPVSRLTFEREREIGAAFAALARAEDFTDVTGWTLHEPHPRV